MITTTQPPKPTRKAIVPAVRMYNLDPLQLIEGVHYRLPNNNDDDDDKDTNNHNNNETTTTTTATLLDAMVLGRLPLVHPHRLNTTTNTSVGKGFAEVVHAVWDHPVRCLTGIGPNAVPATEGGVTVVGRLWPHVLTRLTYLPILKNAHTTLSNAVGDLRQRLDRAIVTVVTRDQSPGTLDTLLQQALHSPPTTTTTNNNTAADGSNQRHSQRLFTLLRDPVDRFLSASCEDMRQSNQKRKCLMDAATDKLALANENNENNNKTTRSGVQCLVESMVEQRRYWPHQHPQVDQIVRTVGPYDVPVSVLYWDQLGQLLVEIGNKPLKHKVRDRTNANYLKIAQSTPRAPPPKKQDATPEKNKGRILQIQQLQQQQPRQRLQQQAVIPKRKLMQDGIIMDESKSTVLGTTTTVQQEDTNKWNKQHDEKDRHRHRRLLGRSVVSAKSRRRQQQQQQQQQSSQDLLTEFCRLKGDDLNQDELRLICQLYRKDVDLIMALGFAVPHCHGVL